MKKQLILILVFPGRVIHFFRSIVSRGLLIGMGGLILSACSTDGVLDPGNDPKTILMSHNLKVAQGGRVGYDVYIGFTDQLQDTRGKVVKKVGLPQRKTWYKLDVNAKEFSNYRYRWIVSAGSQVHTFQDSFLIGPTHETKLTTSRMIQPVNIVHYMPLLMGMNSVHHSLQINNPNPSSVRLNFNRVLYSKSGRIVDKKYLLNQELLLPETTSKLVLKDLIDSDLLLETVSIVIDTVFHL